MAEDLNGGEQHVRLEKEAPYGGSTGRPAPSDTSRDQFTCSIEERVAELREAATSYATIKDEATAAIREQWVDRASIEEYFSRLYSDGPLGGHIPTLSVYENQDGKLHSYHVWHGTPESAAKAADEMARRYARAEPSGHTAHAASVIAIFGDKMKTITHPSVPDRAREVRTAKQDNVIALTTAICEIDSAPLANYRKLCAAGLVPSMLITSGGLVDEDDAPAPKLHAYFVLAQRATGADMERVRRINMRLIRFTGNDGTFKAINHAIRVAGGVHRKKLPRPAQIVYSDGLKYTLEQLEKLLDAVVSPEAVNPASARTPGGRVNYRYELIDKIRHGEDIHASQVALATAMYFAGFDPEEVEEELRAAMEECRLDVEGSRWNARYKDIERIARDQAAFVEASPFFQKKQERRERLAFERVEKAEKAGEDASELQKIETDIASLQRGQLQEAGKLVERIGRLLLDAVTEALLLNKIVEAIKPVGAGVRATDAVRKPLAVLLKATRKAAKEEREEAAKRAESSQRQQSTTGDIEIVRGMHDVLIPAAREAISRKNAENPTLFGRVEGGAVRLAQYQDELGNVVATKFEELTDSTWRDEIHSRVLMASRTIGYGPFASGEIAELKVASKLRLPVLEHVINVPVFGPNGELNTTPGYDLATRTYLLPGFSALPVPNTVTAADVTAAVRALLEAIRDFPFSDRFDGTESLPIYTDEADAGGWCLPNLERGRSSRANMIAVILQTFLRAMIGGSFPAVHIDKNQIGTGANYLLDVLGLIVLGKRMPLKTYIADDNEFRKGLTASLREGTPFLAINNIDHKVDSPTLAAILTAGEYTDRILGVSQNATMKVKATVTLDGNQMQLKDDMVRRILPIRIDAATHDATQDRPPGFFKYDPLHDYVLENRAQLVWSCHVIIRNWLQWGKPVWSGPPLRSFDEYSRVLGGVLVAAGIEGFMGNVKAYQDAKKQTAGGDAQFVTDWVAASKEGQTAATASELFGQMRDLMGGWRYDHIQLDLPPKGSTEGATKAIRQLTTHIRAHIETRTFRLNTCDPPTGSETSPIARLWIRGSDSRAVAHPTGWVRVQIARKGHPLQWEAVTVAAPVT